jgi:DNA/RNA endonuclease YhcR with UshA esterase domain
MKNIMFILVAILAWVSIAVGQKATSVYTLSEVTSHVGEYATVRGEVSSVFESKKGNYFLNMGGQYPHQLFSAVIFSSSSSRFTDIEGLEGKTVEVTGKIKYYQGKPEIILNSASQIKVVQ